MQKSLTDNTPICFVPKNLEKRAKDFELMQAKELINYENFLTTVQHNLKTLKSPRVLRNNSS